MTLTPVRTLNPAARSLRKERRHQRERMEFARDVFGGLTANPKTLPCRYFYDAMGSQLFEQICALPEYYVTRTEDSILRRHANEIIDAVPAGCQLVELGSGSSTKTRRLIDALLRRDGRADFFPIDISPTILQESARALSRDYPTLSIKPVVGEYRSALARLAKRSAGGAAAAPRLILWLGSSVGNFDREQASAFLTELGNACPASDRLLMGVDLRKGREILEPAYDDAAGVTAAFNLNLLRRINGELGGTFDHAAFSHRAVYHAEEGRIAMYLVSTRDQQVTIRRPFRYQVSFAAGEVIHTENSFKYSLNEIDQLAQSSGWQVENRWIDERGFFSVNLMSRIAPA